jgi:DNA-binding NarL/FixJ family response regulator
MILGLETWDARSWHDLATRQVAVARELGAALHLQYGLHSLACVTAFMGDLSAAEDFAGEARLIATVTGTPTLPYSELVVAAYRGNAPQAARAIAAIMQEAETWQVNLHITFANWTRALLNNALGRHDAARSAGLLAFEGIDVAFGPLVVPELAEAASRTGDRALLEKLDKWISEQAGATPTHWTLALAALIRALGTEDDSADQHYREAIRCFVDGSQQLSAARAHLLYGEWLRRRHRSGDARHHLKQAHRAFVAMRSDAFAARALHELRAAGEPVPRPAPERGVDLTAQEYQVARLALEGLTNPEIGTRLFLSPRTVQYHLRKVFKKLGITSRTQLAKVLDPKLARP